MPQTERPPSQEKIVDKVHACTLSYYPLPRRAARGRRLQRDNLFGVSCQPHYCCGRNGKQAVERTDGVCPGAID